MVLAMVAVTLITAWNVIWLGTRVRLVDARAGLLGGMGIIAFMVGAGLVRSELEQFYLSGARAMDFWGVGCDIAVSAMLITCWLRAEPCRLVPIAAR